jgi:hypothetical protein
MSAYNVLSANLDANLGANVRSWHLADIRVTLCNVRFRG